MLRAFLARLYDRVAVLWRAKPCEQCGAPSVGFAAVLTGALPVRGASRPATVLYVRDVRRVCRHCLEAALK